MKIEWLLVPGAMLSVAAGPVHAVQYFSLQQVQAALFPQATEFRPHNLLLTAAQRDAVEKRADVRVREPQLRWWEAWGPGGLQGHLLLDDVTGKHEFISYALALSPQGSVLGMEVMDYRESYGGQVRDARWRNQFAGKGAGDALKVDTDIKNISGATLSCVHLTEGVRRLLASFATVLAPVARPGA